MFLSRLHSKLSLSTSLTHQQQSSDLETFQAFPPSAVSSVRPSFRYQWDSHFFGFLSCVHHYHFSPFEFENLTHFSTCGVFSQLLSHTIALRPRVHSSSRKLQTSLLSQKLEHYDTIPIMTDSEVKILRPSLKEDVISFYFETLYVLEITCVGVGYRCQKPNPNRVNYRR